MERALPLADNMVHFLQPKDNAARDAVRAALLGLKGECAKHA